MRGTPGVLADLTDLRVGRLVVKECVRRRQTPNGSPRTVWLCQCDCGASVERDGATLLARSRLPPGRLMACSMKRHVVWGGKCRQLSDLCVEMDIDVALTEQRIGAQGWPLAEAFDLAFRERRTRRHSRTREAFDMVSGGMAVSDIANRLDRSKQRVHEYISRARADANDKSASREFLARRRNSIEGLANE